VFAVSVNHRLAIIRALISVDDLLTIGIVREITLIWLRISLIVCLRIGLAIEIDLKVS